jgi:hypothetical protein
VPYFKQGYKSNVRPALSLPSDAAAVVSEPGVETMEAPAGILAEMHQASLLDQELYGYAKELFEAQARRLLPSYHRAKTLM